MSRRSALRDRRLACSLTQAELAARAGVSRQLIAAVEAGRNTPAVDAALALAEALGTTVEALFAEPVSRVIGALGERLRDGSAIRVGRVGDQLVGAELADHGTAGAGWAKADGVLAGSDPRLFPGVSPAGCVIAGCDPALGIAEAMLSGLGSRSLLAISAPTGTSLRALEQTTVHAAVVHSRPADLPRPRVPVARWHFARWQVGLAVPHRFRRHSLGSILYHLPVIQRDPAATSQRAFERARSAAGLPPLRAGRRATGHIDAARRAATLSAAAVTTESAARTFDLSFLPLEDHAVEVWIANRWLDQPGIDALGETLATSAFTRRVSQVGGYDMSRCGETVDAP